MKPMASEETGTTRANVARTMVTSLLRAALPPLVAVVTLPIILGRISLEQHGLWATITGLIAVLAAVDAGMATLTTRRVAEARGVDDTDAVVLATRQSVSVLARLALVVMLQPRDSRRRLIRDITAAAESISRRKETP